MVSGEFVFSLTTHHSQLTIKKGFCPRNKRKKGECIFGFPFVSYFAGKTFKVILKGGGSYRLLFFQIINLRFNRSSSFQKNSF
jgi:hypothetical protein